MARNPLNVAVLAYDGLCTFEFGIMVELFGLHRIEFDSWYSMQVCGLEKGPIRAGGGILVEASKTLRGLDHAGTIIIPGWRHPLTEVPAPLIRTLQRAHAQGARILSACSGVFVLAAAGLLDGKTATTHWLYAEALAAAFPELEVNSDVLYVDEGSILTSAGSAAGIDLGLHLIRRDFGAEVANIVARRLVVPPHREGGQQQFIRTPVAAKPGDDAIALLLDRLRGDLVQSHSVAAMARSVFMSPRTFARRFKEATGTTPQRWLIGERVQAAQEMLESSNLGLDELARRVGFGDAQVLRLHFRRVVGTTPSAYQRTFKSR